MGKTFSGRNSRMKSLERGTAMAQAPKAVPQALKDDIIRNLSFKLWLSVMDLKMKMHNPPSDKDLKEALEMLKKQGKLLFEEGSSASGGARWKRKQ